MRAVSFWVFLASFALFIPILSGIGFFATFFLGAGAGSFD